MPQSRLINQLLDANLPFAAFRLPGKKQEIQIVAQKDTDVELIDIENIDKQKGFIVTPFESTVTGKTWCIRPDILIKDTASAKAQKNIDSKSEKAIEKTGNLETTKDEYLQRIEYLMSYLRDSTLEKIVFSRMINIPPLPGFDPVEFFNQLEDRYTDAFIYMFKLPETGLWIGATPETLFHLTDDTVTTVALAGTRPTDDITWTDKEINEQKIVRDFIHGILKENEIDRFIERGPVTIIAGKVVHLKTIFQFPAELVKGKEGKLIRALHPTPAVCGLPKIQAYELIKKLERHERRFYAGFSGPWNLGEESHLFVNLRCAELGASGINVYVGGGITVDSVPEEEWVETDRKSQTLLSVVEKL